LIEVAAGAGAEGRNEIAAEFVAQGLLNEIRIIGAEFGAGPAGPTGATGATGPAGATMLVFNWPGLKATRPFFMW
jgi:hypothetical protein